MESKVKIGEYYNGLLILKIFDKVSGKETYPRKFVEFKCPCGKINDARLNKIETGSTKTCGCRLARKRFPKNAPKVPNVTTIAKYYNDQIHDSNKRGIDFTLTLKEFKEKVQDKKCTYCGRPGTRKVDFKGKQDLFIGLDRIDNSKGYLPENVTPCCTTCNMAKNKQTVEEFMNWFQDFKNFQNNIGVQ